MSPLRPKAPRPPAVFLVLRAEVSEEAFFLAADLQEHDGDEGREDQQGLPGPKAEADAGVIDKTAGQHGVAAQAVGTVGHQVPGAGRDLVAEGVHRVAVAFVPHIDDGPDT